MVLYEKNGNFVGIGKEELSFLGFEDFEEFKSEHKDFADLFVNKPGYIFKFKNFSWIDYTLHSGAPKKAVIIKLKNGQEIETGIKISEIFLLNAQNNSEFYYSIELSQNTLQMQQKPQNFAIESTEEESISYESQAPTIQKTPEPQPLNLEDDYTEEIPEVSEESSFTTSTFEEDYAANFESESLKEEPQNDFKLKIENDVYEETPKLKVDLNFDEEEPKIPSISFGEDKNESSEEKKEEISFVSDYEEKEEPEIALKVFDTPIAEEKPSIEIKEELSSPVETIEFDLAHCADETGLDLSDIAHLLEEYLSDIEKSLQQIDSAIKDNDTQSLTALIVPLKGISDNLRIDELSKVYGKMLSASEDEKHMAYKTFAKFANDLKNELI